LTAERLDATLKIYPARTFGPGFPANPARVSIKEVNTMAITRWDRDLGRFQDRMNRLLEDVFRGSGEQDVSLAQWAPLVDIYEQDGRLVLTAELPGVRPEDVRVNIENNVLTISGERTLEKDVKRDDFYRVERAYGAFSRTFTLSPQYDVENVQAEFKEGVLRITLPRSEKARPRQIPIAGGSTRQQLQGQAAPPAQAQPREASGGGRGQEPQQQQREEEAVATRG
jgi:HSP20 family protein